MREDLLERLPPYKVRAASDELPGRFETGTQPHELYAGLLGAFEYLEWLGREMAGVSPMASAAARPAILAAMNAIRALRAGALGRRSSTASARWRACASTASSRAARSTGACRRSRSRSPAVDPVDITRRLGERGVFATNGTGYALSVIERLGLADRGGVVRLGCVHYNSRDEIEVAMRALQDALG